MSTSKGPGLTESGLPKPTINTLLMTVWDLDYSKGAKVPRQVKFMADAKAIAKNHSKDKSTKLGCLITDNGGSPLVWGYNGFPREVNDDIAGRHARPAKYFYTEHAERNALYNAARLGISLKDSNLYLPTLTPCESCARGIIQVGVSNLFLEYDAVFGNDERAIVWRRDFDNIIEMLIEGGVSIFLLKYKGEEGEEGVTLYEYTVV